MAKYYALRDLNVGYLQWVCEAPTAEDAVRQFDDAVGIDPNDEGLDVVAARFDLIEVTAEQYSVLKGADGTDPEVIDLLDRIVEQD